MDETIFHPGERLVQERTGERGTALINSRSISPGIPAAARNFVGQQRWCIVGAADAAGAMWACLLSGEPGFVQASDDLRSLQVASSDPQGVLARMAPIADLQPGQSIAVLLIELQTRRRLRINGYVAQASAQALEVAVGQAFPVCPAISKSANCCRWRPHLLPTTAAARMPARARCWTRPHPPGLLAPTPCSSPAWAPARTPMYRTGVAGLALCNNRARCCASLISTATACSTPWAIWSWSRAVAWSFRTLKARASCS